MTPFTAKKRKKKNKKKDDKKGEKKSKQCFEVQVSPMPPLGELRMKILRGLSFSYIAIIKVVNIAMNIDLSDIPFFDFESQSKESKMSRTASGVSARAKHCFLP